MSIYAMYLVCGVALLVAGLAAMSWALCRAAAMADTLQREADEQRRRAAFARRGL